MTTSASAADALTQVLGQQAWAVIRRQGEDAVEVIGGQPTHLQSLNDIPYFTGAPESDRPLDTLVAVPFRQIRERGFPAYDDQTPLVAINIDVQHRLAVDEVIDALPREEITFADPGGFETSDAAYSDIVRDIIDNEIGHGEGANLVVARRFKAQVAQWGPEKALSVLRRLLEREQGAYWTFAIWTGERFLVGASPERHVSVRGGDVRMNPISGTFRLRGLEDLCAAERKQRLLSFLADEKEIFELFMVVDEELKMMCDICHEGGQVLGPFLKPMSQLVHTEYLLAGRTRSDVRDVLRDTMFAATVTGAPVENACRLIEKYEGLGRGYYSGALALFGRDADGEPTCDSPIVIRTAEVDADGNLQARAGATLVRDSDPDSEVAETWAKAAGILGAFGLLPSGSGVSDAAAVDISALMRDEDVTIALGKRNQRLAKFWLTDQGGTAPADELAGKQVGVLHGEDDFVNMLAHMFTVLGMSTQVVRHEDYAPGVFADADLVVIGPGPGDPRDDSSPKIAHYRAAVQELLERGTPFWAVCLGHQVLLDQLGIALDFKDIVFQGTQSPVELDGAVERLGFYNTFVGKRPDELPEGIGLDVDPASGDIHRVRGPHFAGVQFHAESILSENGINVIRRELLDLLGGRS